ncbi:MAG: energy-coupling factor transporter transmembrane component T, partial [Limibacillus sp.]
MKRFLLIAAGATSLCIVLVLVAALGFRSTLAEWALKRVLEQQGHKTELTVSAFTGNQVIITGIRSDAASVERLTVDYRPSDLLSGRLEGIDVLLIPEQEYEVMREALADERREEAIHAVALRNAANRQTLAAGLVRLGVPFAVGFSFVMTLQYVFTFRRLFHQILEAQQSRGLVTPRANPIRAVRTYVPVIVPLLIAALRSVDSLTLALMSRGFGSGTR